MVRLKKESTEYTADSEKNIAGESTEKASGLNNGKRHGRRGIRAFVWITAVLLFVALSLLAYISEFWIPPVEDTYEYPPLQQLSPMNVRVGARYPIKVPLDKNETIFQIIPEAYTDGVFEIDDTGIAVLGEYSTSVTVVTSEREIPVPSPRYEEIYIFGYDIAPTLCRIRAYIRDFLGIEPVAGARTELRILNRYKFDLTASLAGDEYAEEQEIYVGNTEKIAVPLAEGERVVQAYSGNDDIAAVVIDDTAAPQDRFSIKGISRGETELLVYVGRDIETGLLTTGLYIVPVTVNKHTVFVSTPTTDSGQYWYCYNNDPRIIAYYRPQDVFFLLEDALVIGFVTFDDFSEEDWQKYNSGISGSYWLNTDTISWPSESAVFG